MTTKTMEKKKETEIVRDIGGDKIGQNDFDGDDFSIPFVKLFQSTSPEYEKTTDPVHIEGAKIGHFFNSITREIYGESVTFVPVQYSKNFLVFKEKKSGGGFYGAFNTEKEANERRIEQSKEEGMPLDKYIVKSSANYYGFIVNDDKEPELVVIPFMSSAIKIAKKWNAIIRMTKKSIFAHSYVLSSMLSTNNLGTWYSPVVQPNKPVTQAVYNEALALRLTFESNPDVMVPTDEKPVKEDGEVTPY